MLQRVANVVLGATILVVASGMLLLHLASGQPAQALVLLLAGLLWAAGLVTSVWGGFKPRGRVGRYCTPASKRHGAFAS
jgi:uncharacterized membrane protein YccC